MSHIASVCREKGLNLEVLASYLGIPLALLEKMDVISECMPKDMQERIDTFVSIRDQMVQEFLDNLEVGLDKISEYKSPLVFVVYSNNEDFQDSGADFQRLTYITHRHIITYLEKMLKEKGITISIVDFDKTAYDAWREEANDSPVARAMWGAAYISRTREAQDLHNDD